MTVNSYFKKTQPESSTVVLFLLLIPANTVLYYTTPDLSPDDVMRSKHTMTLLKKEGHKSHLYSEWERRLLKIQIIHLNNLKSFLHKQIT